MRDKIIRAICLVTLATLVTVPVYDAKSQANSNSTSLLPVISVLLLDEDTPVISDITLEIGVIDSNTYYSKYGEFDELTASFDTNGNENLVVSIIGYDIDTDLEVAVYINGQLLGHLTPGLNNGINKGDSWLINSALLKNGTNTIELVQTLTGERWGVYEILIETEDDFNTPEFWLGLPTISRTAWDEHAVRSVLNVFAFGGHATDFQIATWANMRPKAAILQMLNFAEHNLKLSPLAPGEIYTAPATKHGTLWEFSEDFISSNSAHHPIPKDSGNILYRSQFSLDNWNFDGLWALMVTTRGLNPFRQRIGFWETNYHMAVNLETEVNHHQMAKYYDDILEELEAGKPYQNVIATAAASAAVATQYGHRYNQWKPATGECECNEDFAREIHQLFFGILGMQDPLGIDNHENVTIKNTAKALTDMQVVWSDSLERLPEVVTFGTALHYPGNQTLNILNTEIPGTNAKQRINNIAQVAINHPESLENLPIIIISGLADDNLSNQNKQKLRAAWASMPSKNLLTYLRAYAISSLFHNTNRVKYWTSAERQLLMANKLVLNNTEGIGLLYLYNPVDSWSYGIEAEHIELFRPIKNVFGGQTALEASDSAAVFENNYNRYTDYYWQTMRFTHPDFPNWEKNWASVLPKSANGKYQVANAARWLWKHFLNDGLTNFGPLEQAHVYSLLGSKRDFPLLMCLRQKRINDGLTNNSLDDLESDFTPRCTSTNGQFSQQDLNLLQGAYLTSDAMTTHVQTMLNELSTRELLVTSNNFNDRKHATERIGAAINFILTTPYIFAQEGF